MSLDIIGTWYVPEGETVTVSFPELREGNSKSGVIMADDRGTLLAPAYIVEAESDHLLLLKQFDAARIIESIRAAVQYGDQDPAGPWSISRTEDGQYIVEPSSTDLSEMM